MRVQHLGPICDLTIDMGKESTGDGKSQEVYYSSWHTVCVWSQISAAALCTLLRVGQVDLRGGGAVEFL